LVVFQNVFFLYKYFFYFLKTISKQFFFFKKKKTSNFDATTVQKQPKRGQCPTIYSKLMSVQANDQKIMPKDSQHLHHNDVSDTLASIIHSFKYGQRTIFTFRGTISVEFHTRLRKYQSLRFYIWLLYAENLTND
jgi:hypothetical protein